MIIFFLSCFALHADNVPVVTVEENNRLEELADGTGVNEWRFMTNSGYAVALEAEKITKSGDVVLLIGKGYKGGNALWGGYLLLQKGYHVKAYLLSSVDEMPPVCQKIVHLFENAGGVIQPFASTIDSNADLIIDGLVGTGFKGAARGKLAEAITWANDSGYPILAVDIPSGLNGNTGEVETVAIKAKHTIAISFPKIGFFIRHGIDYVGSFSIINIGLDDDILAQVRPEADLIDYEDFSKYLKEHSDFLTLDRQTFANSLNKDPEFTLDEYQSFAESQQVSLLFTDNPMMIITPFERPKIITNKITLYIHK